MSMGEMAIRLGYTKISKTLQNVIKEMADKGEAECRYPDKPNSKLQKICLKDK